MSDEGEQTDAGEEEHVPASPAQLPSQAPTSSRTPRRHPKMRRQASFPMRRASAPDSNVRIPVQHPLDVTSSDPQKFAQRFMRTGSLFHQRQNVRLEDGRHAISPTRGEKTGSLRTFQDHGQRHQHHGQECTDHEENTCSDNIERKPNCDSTNM